MGFLVFFVKLLMKKHGKPYFKGVLSIFFSIAVMIVFTSLMECVKQGYVNSEAFSSYILLKFGSIQTVFIIAAISFILYRSYFIMTIDYSDVETFMKYGATKKQIRILNYLHTILYMTIIIPLGMIIGVLSTKFMRYIFEDFDLVDFSNILTNSTSIILYIMAVTGFAIFILGIVIDHGIEKKLMI